MLVCGSTNSFEYYKGGSRVLGKGGTKKIEVTVHVMVPSTGRRPVDGGRLGRRRGGGVDWNPEFEKKNK